MAYVGGLRGGSGPKLAVLGADQGLCGQSWPVLGPKWSVLEGDQAGKWPKPEREGDLDREQGPLSIPNSVRLLRFFSID